MNKNKVDEFYYQSSVIEACDFLDRLKNLGVGAWDNYEAPTATDILRSDGTFMRLLYNATKLSVESRSEFLHSCLFDHDFLSTVISFFPLPTTEVELKREIEGLYIIQCNFSDLFVWNNEIEKREGG